MGKIKTGDFDAAVSLVDRIKGNLHAGIANWCLIEALQCFQYRENCIQTGPNEFSANKIRTVRKLWGANVVLEHAVSAAWVSAVMVINRVNDAKNDDLDSFKFLRSFVESHGQWERYADIWFSEFEDSCNGDVIALDEKKRALEKSFRLLKHRLKYLNTDVLEDAKQERDHCLAHANSNIGNQNLRFHQLFRILLACCSAVRHSRHLLTGDDWRYNEEIKRFRESTLLFLNSV